VCNKSFTQQGNLKAHECIYRGDFIQQGNLKAHECIHRGDFTQQGNLKAHECIHRGDFTQQGNLKAHECVHRGDHPFNCGLCNMSFMQQSYMKECNVTCDVNSKLFFQESVLKSYLLLCCWHCPHFCDAYNSVCTEHNPRNCQCTKLLL
jgi:hypothetical protein